MFDSLTTSADGLFVLLYILAILAFVFLGPHKIYESIFGSLIALGAYFLMYEMTYIHSDTTSLLFGGNWLVVHRFGVLIALKYLSFFLFFAAPMSVGLQVSGVVRGGWWFFVKVFILSAFWIIFGVTILTLLFQGAHFLRVIAPFSWDIGGVSYFASSGIYHWIADRPLQILILGFALLFYKLIFSHWITSLGALGATLYLHGSQMFGKKSFDVASGVDNSGHEDSQGHDEHGH